MRRGLGWRRGARCRRGGLHAGQEDGADLHFRVPLPMALQTAIALAPAELLNEQLLRGMSDHVRDDAHAVDEGLADARVVAVLEQQDAVELEACPLLGVAVVHRDEVAFADSILARTVFKDCVHRSLSILLVRIKTITLAQQGSRDQSAAWKPALRIRISIG